MKKDIEQPSNNYEEEKSKREVLLCRKALEVYRSAKFDFIGRGRSHESDASIQRDAEYLANDRGREGLRVSFPANNTRLNFDVDAESGEPYFWLWGSDGIEKERFEEWREFIANRFRENGLDFRNS